MAKIIEETSLKWCLRNQGLYFIVGSRRACFWRRTCTFPSSEQPRKPFSAVTLLGLESPPWSRAGRLLWGDLGSSNTCSVLGLGCPQREPARKVLGTGLVPTGPGRGRAGCCVPRSRWLLGGRSAVGYLFLLPSLPLWLLMLLWLGC